MSEEKKTDEILEKVVSEFVDNLNDGVDFASSQIPQVIEQLLLWHTVTGAIGFVIGLVILISSIRFIVFNVKSYYEEREWVANHCGVLNDGYICSCVLSVMLFIPGVIITLNHLYWIQILVAPKLYVLEYASQLV